MEPYQYIGEELALFAEARNWKHYVAGFMAPYLHGRVLEAGAGMGANTQYLAKANHTAWVCLEPDEHNCKAIRHLISTAVLPAVCSVQHGTLSKLADDSKFDSILYYDVLEHIEDDKGELIQAAKHLNPGGYLIILAPAHQGMFSNFDKAIGHFRRYDKTSLRLVIPQAMAEIRCHYLDSLGFLAYKAFSVFSDTEKVSRARILFWDTWLIPISRIFDTLTAHRMGKSVLGIWQKTH